MKASDLYQKIVSKYPQYSSLSQEELLPKIYSKYPQYQSLIDEPQESSSPNYLLGGYGLGRGMEAAQRGARFSDVPGLAFKAASGYLGGLPEEIAQKPFRTLRSFAQGLPSMGEVYRGEPEPHQIPYPKPVTEEGRQLGGELERFGNVAGGLNALSNVYSFAKPRILGALKNTSLGRGTFNVANFSKELSKQFFDIPHSQFGPQFEEGIEKAMKLNPKSQVNLHEPLLRLKDEMINNSDVAKRMLNGVKNTGDPYLIKVFNDLLDPDSPAFQTGFYLKNSQKFIEAIKKSGLGKKLGNPAAKWDVNELPLGRFYTDVRAAQLANFPEFQDTLTQYKNAMSKFDLLKNQMRPGSLSNRLAGHGREMFSSPIATQAAQELLPKQTYQEMTSARNVARGLRGLKTLGGKILKGAAWTTGAGMVGYPIARRFLHETYPGRFY